MTYNEIISLVVRRLGWSGLASSLKSDVRFAVNMAESELMQDAQASYKTVEYQLNESTSDYALGLDFNEDVFNAPYEIVLRKDADSPPIDHVEVPYDEFLSADTSAMPYFGRTIVSIHYRKDDVVDDYIFSIKPPQDVLLTLSFSVLPNRDVFENLDASPSLPPKFHQYIVAGAVYRLAQVMAGEAKSKSDFASAQFYQLVESRAYSEFKAGLANILSNKDVMDRSVHVVPFRLYDDVITRRNRRPRF